jgi:hypothetical protein
LKHFLSVATIALSLAAAGSWSVPTDTAVHHVAADASTVDQSIVDRQSARDVGIAMAAAPRTGVLSPECWCVDYSALQVPAYAETKQV